MNTATNLIIPHTMTMPKGYMPLTVGGRTVFIFGGPYMAKPPGMFGIKMAREIKAPCDVNIPTEDFKTPAIADARLGLLKIIPELVKGTQMYAGCMGGIGRTGLILGLLVRLTAPNEKIDARAYVRKYYLGHAIETADQEAYVRDFPLSDLRRYLAYFQQLTKR